MILSCFYNSPIRPGKEVLNMMFSSEDLRITSAKDFLEFLPIFFFVGFVAPFLLVSYTVGYISDLVGWLD
jgi:hypothetical protein